MVNADPIPNFPRWSSLTQWQAQAQCMIMMHLKSNPAGLCHEKSLRLVALRPRHQQGSRGTGVTQPVPGPRGHQTSFLSGYHYRLATGKPETREVSAII